MREQDFAACGGVDPDAWRHQFVPIEANEDGDGTEPLVDMPGTTNGILVTVKEEDTHTSSWTFIEQALNVSPHDDVERKRLSQRFWHAVAELRRLKLLYRVMVLWDGNPMSAGQRRKCEPLATLYINDSWARQMDPHLQYGINRAAWRTGARDECSDFNDDSGSIPFVGSGRYRYLVRQGQENRITLLGQLRVRYWPADGSTVSGRAIERQRTETWLKSIEALGR